MTTNREVLDLDEKCGQPFGISILGCVCGRPAGHRPAKEHATEPTRSDIARTLKAPHKRRHARSATEFCDVCGLLAPCPTAIAQRGANTGG